MTPLGALIEEARELFERTHRVPLTNGDIARRSDGALSRQRVQQLATRPISDLPSRKVLEGLSLGLGVPYSVVLARALMAAGYHRDATRETILSLAELDETLAADQHPDGPDGDSRNRRSSDLR